MRLIRRLRTAQTVISAQAARIRELEEQLAAEQDRARDLARSGDPHLVKDLDRQIRDLHATVAALREDRPDDALTTELRRQLQLKERAVRELHERLAGLQAANDADARAAYTKAVAA